MSTDIKKLRKSLGLSQSKFAEKLGVRQSTVWAWECGKSKPRRSVVVLIDMLWGQDGNHHRNGIGA